MVRIVGIKFKDAGKLYYFSACTRMEQKQKTCSESDQA